MLSCATHVLTPADKQTQRENQMFIPLNEYFLGLELHDAGSSLVFAPQSRLAGGVCFPRPTGCEVCVCVPPPP